MLAGIDRSFAPNDRMTFGIPMPRPSLIRAVVLG
jgi:hypothetical protein